MFMNKFRTKNGMFEGVQYNKSLGELHCLESPAAEYVDGTKEWFKDGKLHREGGPAVEGGNGSKLWFINNELHRENGPAVIYDNGDKEWWINGKLHREDGPAVEYANGDKEWWIDDKLHREDGPAVEYANDNKEWWIDDCKYSEEDFHKEIKSKNLTTTDKNCDTEYRDLVWYTVFGSITPKQLLQIAASSTQSLNEIIDKHIAIAKKANAPLLNDTNNVLLDRILNA